MTTRGRKVILRSVKRLVEQEGVRTTDKQALEMLVEQRVVVVQRVVEVLVTRLKHAICQCSEMYRCMERQFP